MQLGVERGKGGRKRGREGEEEGGRRVDSLIALKITDYCRQNTGSLRKTNSWKMVFGKPTLRMIPPCSSSR